MSEGDQGHCSRLRRRFGELVGSVAQTVESPEEVSAEIRELFAALAERRDTQYNCNLRRSFPVALVMKAAD
jgi:hypothetical protein